MYIRTKDGRIVDTTKYPEHPASWGIQASDYALTIKQAETLEELCDCFVILRYQDTFIVDRFSKQICLNHIKCGYGDVYGAIWTSKGLICVAKMNESGDLELI